MQASLPENEKAFFEDVKNLMMTKYPEMQEKYGIWRVHQHFGIAEDEVFHETSNSETKESTLRIIKKNALPKGAFASTWKLTNAGPTVVTWCCDDLPVR